MESVVSHRPTANHFKKMANGEDQKVNLLSKILLGLGLVQAAATKCWP